MSAPLEPAPKASLPARARGPEDQGADEGERERRPGERWSLESGCRTPPDGVHLPWIREAGAPRAATLTAPSPLASTDPLQVAALAEKMLRSLRVGSDAAGRRVVQLELVSGALEGAFIELRHDADGVRLRMRGADGRPDPRADLLVEALRDRGIALIS